MYGRSAIRSCTAAPLHPCATQPPRDKEPVADPSRPLVIEKPVHNSVTVLHMCVRVPIPSSSHSLKFSSCIDLSYPRTRDHESSTTMDYSDPDAFTLPYQLTKKIRRDVYPLLEPTQPELSAKGKTVLITGVSGGIGKVSMIPGTRFSFPVTNRLGHRRIVGYRRCFWHRDHRAQRRCA